MFEAIVLSFRVWPLSVQIVDPSSLWMVVTRISWMFVASYIDCASR